jgi:hypothetical protein
MGGRFLRNARNEVLPNPVAGGCSRGAMSTGPLFRYVDRWRVAGRIADVASILADGESYPRWWSSVYLDVRTVSKGDENRIGEVRRVRARGFLPYEIEFEARKTDERFPHGFSLVAEGELQGNGEWRIAADGPWIDVEYRWEVSGNKPLWRYMSFLLRPLFEANHHWTMRRGEEGMRLELARRLASTPAARLAVPPTPGPVNGAGATLRAFAEVLLHADRGTMVWTSRSTLIRRPAPVVFDFITRLENDMVWQSGIRELSVDTSQLLGAGSTYREVRQMLGRTCARDMRVTAWESERHIAFETARGPMPYRASRVVVPTDEGALLTEYSEMRLPWFVNPFKRRIAQALHASQAGALDRLRARLEDSQAR